MKGATKGQIIELKNSDLEIECITCRETKSFKKFSYLEHKKTGLFYIRYECNSCGYKRKIRVHGWKTSEYNKTQLYKQRHTLDGRAAYLLYGVRERCKRSGFELNIDKEFILNKLNIGVCEATGIELDMHDIIYKPYAPSLDRIDSNAGYTKDNVQLVCMIYNFCKNKFTTEQVNDFITKAKLTQ